MLSTNVPHCQLPPYLIYEKYFGVDKLLSVVKLRIQLVFAAIVENGSNFQERKTHWAM